MTPEVEDAMPWDPAAAPETWGGARIGLLGGSFNPAHGGHRHISLTALGRLGLDCVWWLVSPQNPLKPETGMAPLSDRLAQAREVAGDRRILVTDIERELGTSYTAEVLERLVDMAPKAQFVWMMGSDNLRHFDRWRDWTRIFRTVPIAVFDRANYSLGAVAGSAARKFKRFELPENRARALARQKPPAWILVHGGRHPGSASAIRAARTDKKE